MNTKCSQCGKTVDFLTAFTKYRVCGTCTRANHRKAVNDPSLTKDQAERSVQHLRDKGYSDDEIAQAVMNYLHELGAK